MRLFRRKKQEIPPVSREQSLSTRPVLNRLVKVEHAADGNLLLHIPRRRSAMVESVSHFFRIPPYRKVALDELGSFVIELCDGSNTVEDIAEKLARRFRLNRREAEVSLGTFLRTLTGRSVIALVVGDRHE